MPSISGEATLFNPDPSHYLPHRSPFLFVDRIITLEPGVCATGEVVVTAGCGCFPPVLLLESMAQLGGIAAGQQEGAGGVLAAIERGELPAAVPAGARLLVATRIVKSFGTLHLVEGEVRSEGKVIASATLTLAVGKM
ncbi:3-hydroxyacyl-ACP dehydratase FabZ family protein [Geotalea uraniireducens]|uniref:Beta-hydroxyacyl-(Acyl-carrier-protein) dehydratase, FabA/FabZ n=1 Tax=Geotalea uraniireducens (strain Rf4) TaxID=351605 RepID=A5G7J0_GEOUR|nr:hydroxymyristoyl-ACP dehydratase [Geotalea uraniireducens]ABQ27758.1 Beta-hydroxyacyl-(acyl-carrier-protein) dehydratase, FabA/FabZ [Geotalea uraniireducens Rf4]